MDYGPCLPNFPAFEALGVSHLALWVRVTDAAEISALAERFARDVARLV